MRSEQITLTCPSCGFSRDLPAASVPHRAVTVTCPACGHRFPLADHVAPPADNDEFAFETAPSPPATGRETGRPVCPGTKPAGSSFVTTVAWIFIILCGFSTLISIMQNVMVNTLFPVDEMHKATTAPGFEKMPAFFRFMIGNVRLFFASFLVVSATTLGAAVGLLKRKNWARLLFIVILSLGIAWNIGGAVLQFSFMQDFPQPPHAAHDNFDRAFTTMRTVIMVFSLLTAVAFSGLFGWIIKRLASPEIRREFS